MSELNFIVTLFIAVLGPLLAIGYLKPILLVVLDSLCVEPLPGKIGAHFWVRSACVLAVAGALVLALSFGEFDGSLMQALRRALWLAAAGSFVSIAFITSRVWAPVQRRLNAQLNGGRG
ncbi:MULTISPECIES: hypothetical protein [Roseateles]|uniref:DUF4149 domain-containing protein n=1 Tax=Pelomonas aquatica TaxID=431058 RepID=A0ABU1ZDD2_9BURK|nr:MULTISPECIES: hypothetical protein [Roseateles]KQY88764.1 hypothetical protein ASD35_14610 [Pelomonas sp. Root1444]MDR7297696.1 hypothetical protein [Pelomonas aquatica]